MTIFTKTLAYITQLHSFSQYIPQIAKFIWTKKEIKICSDCNMFVFFYFNLLKDMNFLIIMTKVFRYYSYLIKDSLFKCNIPSNSVKYVSTPSEDKDNCSLLLL